MSSLASHPVARLPEEWAEIARGAGERPFRAKEIFKWIHQRGVTNPANMTSLPAGLRTHEMLRGKELCKIEHVHRSKDGTRKLLLRMSDDAPIETVLLPRVSGPGSAGADAAEDDDDDDDAGALPNDSPHEPRYRVTQCISSHVG